MADTFQFIPLDKAPVANGFEVGGVLFDDTTKEPKRFIVRDLADLIRQCKLAAINQGDAKQREDGIVLNVAIDVTPDQPTNTTPTPEQLAKQAWQAADLLAQAAIRQTTPIPYRTPDDSDVQSLIQAAQKLYLKGYLNLG